MLQDMCSSQTKMNHDVFGHWQHNESLQQQLNAQLEERNTARAACILTKARTTDSAASNPLDCLYLDWDRGDSCRHSCCFVSIESWICPINSNLFLLWCAVQQTGLRLLQVKPKMTHCEDHEAEENHEEIKAVKV
jgi:hypothetical protein